LSSSLGRRVSGWLNTFVSLSAFWLASLRFCRGGKKKQEANFQLLFCAANQKICGLMDEIAKSFRFVSQSSAKNNYVGNEIRASI
jgi:hypothetical protein